MITYVKDASTNSYNVLYGEAVDALRAYYESLPESDPRKLIDIDTIEIGHLAQYFYYMRDLTEIDMANNALKFTKLPLGTEKNFEINLDTRKITIPKELESISVAGDEIAEIVYFEVDRYYDATDLNEQKIIIEWINANGQKGYSLPYGKDTELIPGKIVFGWPLSSKITNMTDVSKQGTVKFAVRFYRADDTTGSSGVTYSLSTLEHSIKIQPAINVDLNDIVTNNKDVLKDDVLAIIAARATNSKNDNGAKAGVPVIFYIGEDYGSDAGLGDAVDSKGEIVDATRPGIARVVYINDTEEDVARIAAGVYADGDGVLTGSFWKKIAYNNKEGMDRIVVNSLDYEAMTPEEKAEVDAGFLSDRIWGDYVEIPVADAQAEINSRAEGIAGIIYHKDEETEGGVRRFVKISKEAVLALNPEEDAPVYRLDFPADISTVGVYQFVAKVQAGSNEEERKSDYVLVFPPIDPKEVHVEGQKKMVEGEQGYSATLNAMNDDFAKYPLDEACLPPDFVEYDKDVYPFDGSREWLTYKWYRNGDVKAPIEELDNEAYEVLAGTEKSLTVSDEGYYKCGLVGHLNNSATEEIFSDPFRVTRPASRFVLTLKGHNVLDKEIQVDTDVNLPDDADPEIPTAVGYDEDKGLEIVPTLTDPDYMDAFSYSWYRYVCNQEDSGEYKVDPADAIAAVRGVYEPDLNGSIAWAADVLQEGATAAEFTPTQGGVYFCVVTNTYNDDTYTVCSPFMAFNENK